VDDAHALAIPAELRALIRWVLWKWVKKPKKWDKPPIGPTGQPIDQTNPENWLSFEEARRLAREHGHGENEQEGGPGIALGGPENPLGLVGVDLDGCIDSEGRISQKALDVVHKLKSYTERTPSRAGLRVLLWAKKPGTKCKTKDWPGIEIYESDRYLTVTGQHLEGTPTTIEHRQPELDALYHEVFPTKPKSKPARAAGNAQSNGPLPPSDEELLEKARRARNGAQFAALFDAGDISGYPSDSEADLALMNMLAFWTRGDQERMRALFSRSALGQREKWQDRRDYQDATIDKALEGRTEFYDPQPRRRRTRPASSAGLPSGNGDAQAQAVASDDRPAVEISVRRDLALEATIKALASDLDLYCRGETLGVVVQEQGDIAKLPGGIELRQARGTARFVPLTQAVLGCRLTQIASFFRWHPDKHGELVTSDCHPPDWLISAVTEHRYWPGVRPLLSIAQCPYVAEDGSLPTPGFDAATGTIYLPSVEIPALPDRPTREDAAEAGNRLYKLVYQFPFEDGFSFSVWLSNLLTCIQRPLIAGPVPGHVYNGNVAGVGKGLLIDLIGTLAYGHPVGTRAYPLDPVEAEKVKLSIAMAAIPIVHFDNLPEGGFYGGGVMDSALTSRFAEGRILGQTRESGPVPLRPVWTVSGNNISPFKDAYRRWLPCNLVTTLENPHERKDLDAKDLLAVALDQRAKRLRDALIILKAHALEGRPTGDWGPLGSFEEWDRIVRGAIWFATKTKTDCLTTQRKSAAERPDLSQKAALLQGWLDADPGRKGMTAEEALAIAEYTGDDPRACPTLRAALLGISKNRSLPTSRDVGYKLRSMKATPLNHMRFEASEETRDGDRLWRVVAC
jgi:hypothetical protein